MLTFKSPPIVNWLMVVLHSISLSHGQPSMACSRDCDNTVVCLADPLLGVHQSIFTASFSLKRLAPNEQKKKVELRCFLFCFCRSVILSEDYVSRMGRCSMERGAERFGHPAFTLYSPAGPQAADPVELALLRGEILAWPQVLHNGEQYEPARLLYIPLLASHQGLDCLLALDGTYILNVPAVPLAISLLDRTCNNTRVATASTPLSFESRLASTARIQLARYLVVRLARSRWVASIVKTSHVF
jgi:hypothetical protein